MSDMISAQVSDELAEQIDDTRDGDPPEYDEPRSAAVRRLVRSGLDATETTNTFRQRLGTALLALLVVGWPTLAAYMNRPLTAATFVALIFLAVLFQPQISRALDHLPNPLNRH